MAKVLQVVGALNAGGVEALMVDIYRHSHEKHDFIFLCYLRTGEEYLYEKEVQGLGGKIVRIKDNRIRNPIRFIKDIINTIKTERISIVHSHVDLSSAYSIVSAWIAGVDTRISHSHNSSFSMPRALHPLLKYIINKLSTTRIAVSSISGAAMFGGNSFKTITNGINVNKFKYSDTNRSSIRRQLNIGADSTVWLNIGRLSYQKNQKKLINDFANSDTTDSYLIILGEGPLLEDLKLQALNQNVSDKVFFMGRVHDAYRYYSAADLFILTSRYEGLSLACVEAQANGIPCIFPDNISQESIINVNVHKGEYSNDLHLERTGDISLVYNYDIATVSDKITRLYGSDNE